MSSGGEEENEILARQEKLLQELDNAWRAIGEVVPRAAQRDMGDIMVIIGLTRRAGGGAPLWGARGGT